MIYKPRFCYCIAYFFPKCFRKQILSIEFSKVAAIVALYCESKNLPKMISYFSHCLNRAPNVFIWVHQAVI